MVFNEQLKRNIPDKWQVSTIGKTFRTDLGGTPSTKKSEYWNTGSIAWVNSGEVSSFPVTHTELKITDVGLKNSAAKLLPKHTVILSIVRHIRVSYLAMSASTNQSVVSIQESETIKYPYIYLSILRDVPRLMSLRTGAQQPHINKEEVDNSFIVVPEESILHAYNELSLPIFQKIEDIAIENNQLKELRDWLMPLLITGQLTVNKDECIL
jgi:type I restriction enzyme S subunit